MGASTRDSIYIAPPVDLVVMDLPPLFPGDELTPGVYVAARTGGKEAGTGLDGNGTAARVGGIPPIVVYISRDGGTVFTQFCQLSVHAYMGKLLATATNKMGESGTFGKYLRAAAGAQLAIGWESVSKMPVQWRDAYAPASTTEVEVLNGANRVIVGSEIMAYKTIEATPYSSGFGSDDGTTYGVYWHSALLRGLRGTENEIAGRDAGDLVVAVDPASVLFVPINAGDLSKELIFKAATAGFDLADAEPFTLTPTGKNVLPLPVAAAYGTRDSSNNLTINWARRTRSQVRTFGVKAWPYGEDVAEYKVEILSVAGPYTVERTIEVSAETASYTAAQHSTDGLTAGAATNIRIYQKSNVGGWGLYSTWTIPANAGGSGTPTPSAKLTASRID
jgi:hypothetical protein